MLYAYSQRLVILPANATSVTAIKSPNTNYEAQIT